MYTKKISLAFLALILTGCITFAVSANAAEQATKPAAATQSVATDNNDNSSALNNTAEDNNAADNELFIDEENATSDVDPFEGFNRAIFGFNRGIDKVIIRPVAIVYETILPNVLQKGVHNFFSNIGEIPSFANDILQANVVNTMTNTWRFVINSTVGVLGIFDVASRLGLKKNHQDLGMTFAKWGNKKSPYLVLPILGPSTIRDSVGLVGNYQLFTIWTHVYPYWKRFTILGVDLIDRRAKLLPGDKAIDAAFDPYVAVRSAYLQHRAYLIDKNKKPTEEEAAAPMQEAQKPAVKTKPNGYQAPPYTLTEKR